MQSMGQNFFFHVANMDSYMIDALFIKHWPLCPYMSCLQGTKGQKGDVGPEGTPGQTGLPGKIVKQIKIFGFF